MLPIPLFPVSMMKASRWDYTKLINNKQCIKIRKKIKIRSIVKDRSRVNWKSLLGREFGLE